jgi:hypothetical protein
MLPPVIDRTPAGFSSSVLVHKYRGGKPEPATIPEAARYSEFYETTTSLRHADYAAAPDVDLALARPEIDQLARLEPVLRETLLASAGPEAKKLSLARAESLVLRHGVPLVWTYVGTVNGLSVGMPGTWEYADSPGIEGYDPRLEPWYVDGVAADDLFWSSGVDENGLGLLMSLTEAVRDEGGRLLGVAAIDLPMRDLIDTLLEIPELAAVGAEALLLDDQGRVQVRSTQKEVARTMTEFVPVPFEDDAVRASIQKEGSGHGTLADGRLVFWTSLGRVGLTYMVMGREDQLRAALPPR